MSKEKATSKAAKKSADTKKAAAKKRISLAYEGEPGLELFVAGDFNDWTISDKKKAKQFKEDSEGKYSINMYLPQGDHEYKLYADGRWFVDPNSEVQKQNIFGSFNSVIKVG